MQGPGNGRGLTHITAGFIQTITDVVDEGFYDNNSRLVSSYEGMPPLNDSQTNPATYPWYGIDAFSFATGSNHGDDYDKDTQTFSTVLADSDRPRYSIPLYWYRGQTPAEGDSFLTDVKLVISFQLDVSAATVDPTIGGEQVYTRFASADWEFNGSGNVGPAPDFVWTPLSHSQGISAPVDWTIVTDGSRSPLPPNVANDAIQHYHIFTLASGRTDACFYTI